MHSASDCTILCRCTLLSSFRLSWPPHVSHSHQLGVGELLPTVTPTVSGRICSVDCDISCLIKPYVWSHRNISGQFIIMMQSRQNKVDGCPVMHNIARAWQDTLFMPQWTGLESEAIYSGKCTVAVIKNLTPSIEDSHPLRNTLSHADSPNSARRCPKLCRTPPNSEHNKLCQIYSVHLWHYLLFIFCWHYFSYLENFDDLF